MSPLLRFAVQQAICALILAGILIVAMAFAQWYVVSPIGYRGGVFLFISSFLILPLLLGLPAVLVGALLLPFKKTRRAGVAISIFGLILFVSLFAMPTIGGPIRTKAFHDLAIRSQTLVDAISRFTTAKGHPPATLQDLVPDFLPAIPTTGMPSYPNYEYSTESERWKGNPWVLYIDTPIGLINWDMFLYFPLQNYPEEGYGGYLQRVGTWAYVHE
jgi:hypothetical protein